MDCRSFFAADDVQRRAPLRSGFGEDQGAIGKVESCKGLTASQLGIRRAPVQPAGNHQVKYQPEIVLHSNGDALADAPYFAYQLTLNIRKRRLHGAKQKRACRGAHV